MAHGGYNDGRTSARHPVEVILGDAVLTIRDPVTGRDLAVWQYDALVLRDEPVKDAEILLSSEGAPRARLTVDDVEAVAAIKARCGHLWQARERHGRKVVLASLAGAVALIAVIWLLPTLAAPVAALIPEAVEREWGDGMAGQMSPDYCMDAAGQAAIDRLVVRLAGSKTAAESYRVHVIAWPEANAFALPGGHIMVLSGLIDLAGDDPNVLAGVLAHEMAHVSERDVVEGLVRSMGLNMVLGAVLGGDPSIIDGVGGHLLQMSYSRDTERRADAVGGETLRRAGIGAAGLRAFLEKAKEMEGDMPGALTYLSSHPAPAERVETLADAQTLSPAMTGAEWAAVRTMCPTVDPAGGDE